MMKVRGLLSIGIGFALLMSLAGCEGPKAHHDNTVLSPVHYNYIYLFANYELVMDIAPDGTVSARQQTGQSAADVSRASGQLTPEQRGELLQAFNDWEDLKPNYPADVTPLYQITYGNYRVVAGNNPAVPPQFKNAQAVLDRIARSIFTARAPASAPH